MFFLTQSHNVDEEEAADEDSSGLEQNEESYEVSKLSSLVF